MLEIHYFKSIICTFLYFFHKIETLYVFTRIELAKVLSKDLEAFYMMWLLRLLLLALIIFIVYRILSYAASPVRRLEFAKRRNKFYMIDDKKILE